MNPTGRKHSTPLKIAALLSVVRWYNILLIALAQYLMAVFVMNDWVFWKSTLVDTELHLIVIASVFTVASGFIINNFYDWEKDLINRPAQTLFERILTRRETLNLYLIFNTIATGIGLIISWRAFLFFAVYAAGFWLYSHKFKKITILGNVTAAVLAIQPIFAVFLYYGLHRVDVIVYINFIVFIEITRSLAKDVEAIKGDILLGYPTLPAVWGVGKTTQLIYGLLAISFMPAILFAVIHPGVMRYVPLGLAVIGALGARYLRHTGDKNLKGYAPFNNIAKTIITLSVLSIPLLGSSADFTF